ncbi:Aste57867_23395 [Aphanomyces stellatus]|uniref:Aste57867_23395 protein n=1 Tax=Aphanomyces stellatus TaxID=120398 RepID=A0A485LMN1_9STRA|nr:hypothetical protein As57867_023324 [Aphanomyces stellatus]VFU00041.1 Aste57867_23395 [Aphanomyces stellatus]
MEAWTAVSKALNERGPAESSKESDLDFRMEAYLKLNELVEEPDTAPRLRALSSVLPNILCAFQADLRNSDSPLMPVCLRAVSYFIYHEHIARMFPQDAVQSTIDSIIDILNTTNDQTIYLLCLWSLTKQNFDEDLHKLVPRLIEVFCQACINDFHSRKIQLHALYGMHTILAKHPKRMLARDMLKKWCHVVSRGLASSDKQTRDASRKIFQEMCKFPIDDPDIVTTCIEMYALPAMTNHMQLNRPIEAIHIWGFVIVFLRDKLSKDDKLLNSVCTVPEVMMDHADSRVRLLTIQHWRSVVGIYRRDAAEDVSDPQNFWLFRQSRVGYVMRPLLKCFQSEPFEIVLSACRVTWHYIISAAVKDFNAFCQASVLTVKFCKSLVPRWKQWWEIIVTQCTLALLGRIEMSEVGENGFPGVHPNLIESTLRLVARIWIVDDDQSETCKSYTNGTEIGSSRFDTLSISNTPLPPSMNMIQFEPLFAKKSVAMFVVFQSALNFVATLLEKNNQFNGCGDIALSVWCGICYRLQSFLRENECEENVEIRKMFRRLMTKCYFFMLGCQQPQQYKTGSQNPDPSVLFESTLHCRIGLIEVVLGKLDRACFQDAVTQSTTQLLPALMQKSESIEKAFAIDADWLRASVFTEECRGHVLGCASYCTFLELLKESKSPTSGGLKKLLLPVGQIFYQLSSVDIPVDVKGTLVRASQVLQAVDMSIEKNESQFEKLFKDMWDLSGKKTEAESSDASIVSPWLMEKDMRSLVKKSQAIRPELVDCKELFSSIKHHFPPSFRQLHISYKIKTIGDLSAKSLSEISALPFGDSVSIVNKALDEFVGRRERLNTIANKSPMKRKLPFSSPQQPILPFTSSLQIIVASPNRKMKSAMRNLSKEVAAAGDDGASKPAENVKFSVERSDGTMRVIRPGEDSQQTETEETKDETFDVESKKVVWVRKMASHIERGAFYWDKVYDGGSLEQDEHTKVISELSRAYTSMSRVARQVGTWLQPSIGSLDSSKASI